MTNAEQKYWWQDRARRMVSTNLREIGMWEINAAKYVQACRNFRY